MIEYSLPPSPVNQKPVFTATDVKIKMYSLNWFRHVYLLPSSNSPVQYELIIYHPRNCIEYTNVCNGYTVVITYFLNS